MPFAALLTNKWVWAGALVLAVGVGLIWFYLDAKAAGAAGAVAAGLAEAARRATLAQRAKSEVKPNDKAAMDRDPDNRDNQ